MKLLITLLSILSVSLSSAATEAGVPSKGIGPYELAYVATEAGVPSKGIGPYELPFDGTPAGGAVPDSLDFERLDRMMANYTEAISNESVEVKGRECDFLISSVKDSLTMQHIALWLYDHYKESELMGDEAVAIHVYDNWFNNGVIAMRSEFDKLDADIFTTFNRSTLLGMKAPTVDLKNPCGRKVRIPVDGSHSILFFFDTGCAKCQLESKVLPGILEKIQFPTKFYAVYCGHDKAQWRKFRCSFKVRNRNVGIVHLWDPDMDTDMLRLYGVISTPRLYFTDTDGEILGRRLEAESLAEIIQYINAYYGQKEKQ